MLNLLKFEINRNKGILFTLVSMMTLFGILLLLIDTDHEEIVITISVLKLFIPFLLIVVMDLVHTKQDFRLDTKNLYLSIPKTSGEIIGAKITFAMMNYMLFFMMIFIFNSIDVFSGYAPYYAVTIIVLGILIELAVILFTLRSRN